MEPFTTADLFCVRGHPRQGFWRADDQTPRASRSRAQCDRRGLRRFSDPGYQDQIYLGAPRTSKSPPRSGGAASHDASVGCCCIAARHPVAVLFAMWFASGIVMHFVPYPALTEAERLGGLAPPDLWGLAHGPAEAVAASGDPGSCPRPPVPAGRRSHILVSARHGWWRSARPTSATRRCGSAQVALAIAGDTPSGADLTPGLRRRGVGARRPVTSAPRRLPPPVSHRPQ